MKTWKLNLYHHIYSYVASGEKAVEGRAWSKKINASRMAKAPLCGSALQRGIICADA